ncbi:MAG: putative ribosomally synthesized peptide with SipW-like signal peptide [Haloarculaceae archaeon]|jgi:predicted ribosomally synthesized peptide with SipW-like signal peptide
MKETTDLTLSRRQVLAGLGAVGLASTGAGLGTSAYFSDRETFEDNSLVAGELDVKVDWEEHYSDWSSDEAEFAEMADFETADYVLPAPVNNPDSKDILLRFRGEDPVGARDALWDATSVEAYPDGFLNGGLQDGTQDDFDDEVACSLLTDVGDGAPGLRSRLRTEGTFAGQTTAPGDPLIDLQDIKPGDFGEVTFSFHLCDNPGYVWLNGELAGASENGYTEPERSDPDEEQSADADLDRTATVAEIQNSTIELLDEIQTRLWYDDGDNQIAEFEGPLDLVIVVDTSTSIQTNEMSDLTAGVEEFIDAIDALGGDVRAGLVRFGGDTVEILNTLTGTVTDLTPSIDGLPASGSGNTPLPPAIDIADQLVTDAASGARPGADKALVVFTDGGPNYTQSSYSASAGGQTYQAPRAESFTADPASGGYDAAGIDTSQGGISPEEKAETAITAEQVRDGGTRIVTVAVRDPVDNDPEVETLDYLRDEIASSQADALNVAFSNLPAAANTIAVLSVTEKVFFYGTLREALAALMDNDGRGIPLDGNPDTQFNEIGDPENDPDREPFAGAGTSHYVGFEWWLPVDHANQIQTDSMSFDVGFYTEQARHNDGSGMAPETETEREPETETAVPPAGE